MFKRSSGFGRDKLHGHFDLLVCLFVLRFQRPNKFKSCRDNANASWVLTSTLVSMRHGLLKDTTRCQV